MPAEIYINEIAHDVRARTAMLERCMRARIAYSRITPAKLAYSRMHASEKRLYMYIYIYMYIYKNIAIYMYANDIHLI